MFALMRFVLDFLDSALSSLLICRRRLQEVAIGGSRDDVRRGAFLVAATGIMSVDDGILL